MKVNELILGSIDGPCVYRQGTLSFFFFFFTAYFAFILFNPPRPTFLELLSSPHTSTQDFSRDGLLDSGIVGAS